MDLRGGFVFNKCFCCSKNFNVSQLIELNTNSVMIGEETIDFIDILLDVCLISIDSTKTTYICEECKNQLVYFHMFKRDIKKYNSFASVKPHLEILAKVEEFLNCIQYTEEIKVFQHGRIIFISAEEDSKSVEFYKEPAFELQEAESFEMVMHEKDYEDKQDITETTRAMENEITEESKEDPEEHEVIAIEETEVVEHYDNEAIEQDLNQVIEEYIEDIEDVDDNSEQIKCEVTSETEIIKLTAEEYEQQKMEFAEHQNPPGNLYKRIKRQRKMKYKYPINTNDKLTEQQRDWINKQARDSQIIVNNRVAYKCPMCDTILRISGSLKKHLRDSHILKSQKALEVCNSRRNLKDEITQSKLVVDTSDGPQTIWKCQRCGINRIFRSEAGLKVHIRYSHIRSQIIDAKFVAQCKVAIESDFGLKEGWKCPECGKILMSRDGLRNHVKLEHPETVKDAPTERRDRGYDFEELARNESLEQLLQRKRRTLKNDPANVLCKECGIQFINGTTRKENSSKIHHECHQILNVVSHYYQLPKCEETKTLFSNDENLQNYLNNMHYFLPLPCEGMTARVSQRRSDPTGNTTDEDAWKCGHCGARYQSEVDCISHVMILHSKKLICPVDHMEFEGSRGISHFNIHMHNKHNDMFPDLVISCTYCHEEFSSVFEKLAHMKTCSEKKFQCDHCSRSFFTKTELIRHLKLVSGEIKYVCGVCSKSCSSTMDLRLHQTSHTNQKSYACTYPECDKAFKTPAARSSHMETHSNINFVCTYCSAQFRQRALLQRHLKKGFCKTIKRNIEEEIYDDSAMYVATEVSS